MGSATWTSIHQRELAGCPMPAVQTNSDSQGDQSATCWQIDYIEPFLSWKGQHCVLRDTDSEYGFTYLAHNASVETICGLTEYLSTTAVFQIALFLINEVMITS